MCVTSSIFLSIRTIVTIFSKLLSSRSGQWCVMPVVGKGFATFFFILKTQQCFLFSLRKIKGNLITKDTILHFVRICILMQTASQIGLFAIEWVLNTCSKHVRKTEYMAVSDHRAICWTHLHLPNSVKSSSLGRGVGQYGGGFPSTYFETFIMAVIYWNNKKGNRPKLYLINQAHITWEDKSLQ